MDINVGDVVRLKKQHPCGSKEWPENIPILESDRTLPTNPYGESKLCLELCACDAFPVTISS